METPAHLDAIPSFSGERGSCGFELIRHSMLVLHSLTFLLGACMT